MGELDRITVDYLDYKIMEGERIKIERKQLGFWLRSR